MSKVRLQHRVRRRIHRLQEANIDIILTMNRSLLRNTNLHTLTHKDRIHLRLRRRIASRVVRRSLRIPHHLLASNTVIHRLTRVQATLRNSRILLTITLKLVCRRNLRMDLLIPRKNHTQHRIRQVTSLRRRHRPRSIMDTTGILLLIGHLRRRCCLLYTSPSPRDA